MCMPAIPPLGIFPKEIITRGSKNVCNMFYNIKKLWPIFMETEMVQNINGTSM